MEENSLFHRPVQPCTAEGYALAYVHVKSICQSKLAGFQLTVELYMGHRVLSLTQSYGRVLIAP